MTPKVLLYGLPPMESMMIRGVLAQLGVDAVEVPKQDWGKPIGALAGESLPLASAKAKASALTSPMLVLCGVSSEQMDGILNALRSSGLGRSALKAVLTPTNRYWNAPMLCAELVKEHKAMSKK